MSVLKISWTFLMVGLMAASVASARQPIGTAKARGDYHGFSSSRQSSTCNGRSYRTYAPIVRTAPAPIVAEAPVEGRRFSYDPSADAEQGVVEPAAPIYSGSQVMEGAERSYYSPAPQRSYRAYSGGSRRSDKPAWALPKTDPRKYRVGR
jgi:hypothetical protein